MGILKYILFTFCLLFITACDANHPLSGKSLLIAENPTEILLKEAYDNLQIGYVSGNDEFYVTYPVVLPKTSLHSTVVHWASSEPTIINPLTGDVKRPLTQDVLVTLIANIYLGDKSMTKYFELNVPVSFVIDD